MWFEYENRKYCVNVDWLQYSVHLKEQEPELLCPENCRLEICQGNNIFEHRALLFSVRGEKLLTMLWKPFSKILPSNLMTVQVANSQLYLPAMAGIRWSFELVQSIVECSFNAVGRIDLCCDFEATEREIQMITHLNSGHIYAQHKSEGSSWWHEVGGNYSKKQLHCLTWGSPSSEIKVKLYNKSREQGLITDITAQPEKPWIVEQWKQVGMDISRVWRLEFSLCGAGQLRYNKEVISLDMLSNPDWLLDVFCDMYHNRFVTRINQGRRKGHKNNDIRVYLFPLPIRGRGLKWAEPKGKDFELPPSIELLRSMMRQIDNSVVMASRPMFEDYANTICNLIDRYHLEGYFIRTWEKPTDEYFDELYKNVGQGIKTTTPNPRKLME